VPFLNPGTPDSTLAVRVPPSALSTSH
jgi:hypothetical protein